MFKRLITRRGPVPNLIIAQRVIDKMAAAASRYIEDETGEAMVGLVLPPQGDASPTYVVLETISPDTSAVRQLHTFQQGDPWQDEVIWWYQENWHQRRKTQGRGLFKPRPEWDAPLAYLGDWHKQPGYMIAPSGGDLDTALTWLDDPDTTERALLVPIVTLDHPGTVDPSPAPVNYVVVPQGDGGALRVDWWYVDDQRRMFQPIVPQVVPDADLPDLGPMPWHLMDEDRNQHELRRLEEAGMAATVSLADIDGEPPLEICISAARMRGGTRIYLIATPHDFPASPPKMRLAPVVQMKPGQAVADLFDQWWREGEAVQDPPGWTWEPTSHIVDYIEAVEAHLKLYTPQPAVLPAEDTEQSEARSTDEGDL